MRFSHLAFFLVAAAVGIGSAEEPMVNSVALNGHNFTLPDGFEIELAAGPPLLDRPITIDLDERGRLYVSESSGSSEKVEVQLEKKPHRILQLTDTDGDGRFDEKTVFADQMMFPEGTMWYAGSLYVTAPPSIWKLTDTNDDGVADKREEWFNGKTLTGCANDLHGPYLGPDGWIYWCKGAFAKQTHIINGKEWSTRASHVFRCRPDGTGLEPVITGGMDNPVDLAFLPNGERVVSNTFIVHPGGGKRDGLIHAVYGGIYGKDHEPIYEHPWTSPQLMPVLSHLGPAAACGLHCLQSDALGKELQGNLFTCCFNMRKVTRTILTTKGASFASDDRDFLVSDHVDFHPTDVIEDADGSLLVVDTGGWYKLCCPTSQIQKIDVLGGIYRIRRKDAQTVDDPRGLNIAWQELPIENCSKLLGDRRPAVQRRAMETLAAHGAKALPALEDMLADESVVARRNVYWTLGRIDDPEARRISARGMADAHPDVRQVAGHVASLWRDPAGMGLQVRSQAANQRIAAEVAGRCGDLQAYDTLLSLFAKAPEPGKEDRELEHSMIYAMWEIAERNRGDFEPKKGIESKYTQISNNPRQARAQLVVLDQLKSKALRPEKVLPTLDSNDGELRDVAFWIISRRADWGNALVDAFRTRVSNPDDALPSQLAKLAKSPAVQELLASVVRDPKSGSATRHAAMQAMAGANLAQVPPSWYEALRELLARDEAGDRLEALQTARSLVREKQRAEPLIRELLRIASLKDVNAETRTMALSAVGGLPEVNDTVFQSLRVELPCPIPEVRSRAAEIVSKAKFNNEQLLALADDFKNFSPLEVDQVLKAFAQSSDEEIGLKLVASLRQSKTKSSLPVGTLRERLKKFGPKVQEAAEKLYAELDEAAGQQKERLEALIKALPPGDVRRGQQVFHSAKALCSQCHAIGYAGGTVGPDMTRIGLVRTERDLLESLLFPSNSFVQGYEPSNVVTIDGKTYSGLIRRPAPGEVNVITGANQIVRLTPDDIDEVTLGKVSVMPAGLDQQLTTQQVADLVAYLKSCR
jgi:putative membrane-bound dehydrogenase-like protein